MYCIYLIHFFFIFSIGISSSLAKSQHYMVLYYRALQSQNLLSSWKELDRLGGTQLCKNIAKAVNGYLERDLIYEGTTHFLFRIEYHDDLTREKKCINNIPVLRCDPIYDYAEFKTPPRPTQYIKADSDECVWEVGYKPITNEMIDPKILSFIKEICSPDMYKNNGLLSFINNWVDSVKERISRTSFERRGE